MKIENLKCGMPVVYVPKHLLGNKDISDDQLGVVVSINKNYAFVKYINSNIGKATLPEDLYPVTNRPDLAERIGIEIKPINRIYEIYIEQKKWI